MTKTQADYDREYHERVAKLEALLRRALVQIVHGMKLRHDITEALKTAPDPNAPPGFVRPMSHAEQYDRGTDVGEQSDD